MPDGSYRYEMISKFNGSYYAVRIIK